MGDKRFHIRVSYTSPFIKVRSIKLISLWWVPAGNFSRHRVSNAVGKGKEKMDLLRQLRAAQESGTLEAFLDARGLTRAWADIVLGANGWALVKCAS